MSTQKEFDQDDVFNEEGQPSAFDGEDASRAGTAKSGSIGKPEKKPFPLLRWIVIGVAGALLLSFVLVRIISGGRNRDGGAEISPIVQSTPSPSPAPAPAMAVTEPASAPPASINTAPAGGAAAALVIPGDDPESGAVPTSPAPAAAGTAAVSGVATTVVDQAQSEEERKRLNERIAELTQHVKQLEDERAARGSQPQHQESAPPVRVRKASVAAKPRKSPPVAVEKKPRSSTGDSAPAPIVGFTLKAIVEDSAWLQTSSGETVMVQPGDVIHGVGTVKTVDPDAGTVRLTDGRVLR